MFNRRRIKELECQVASLEESDRQARERYWNLRNSHEQLLAHLGLVQEKIPQRVILRPVGEVNPVNSGLASDNAMRGQQTARESASFYPAPDFGQGIK